MIDHYDNDWREVPGHLEAEWRHIFNSSREGLNLSAPCPVCGRKTLHKWFHLEHPKHHKLGDNHFVGTGSRWEWCSHCRTYAHYSAAVPEWWSCDLLVDTANLRHHPAEIERSLRRASQ